MEKINKAAARKMWNESKEFWITACNMIPFELPLILIKW